MKKQRRRWVIKVGSAMVMSGGPLLIRAWMEQVAELKRRSKIDVIWVSSGAIASAVNRTSFEKTKHRWKLSEKQGLSAIGQPILMELYNIALGACGLIGAQVLLTSDDLQEKKRRSNFSATVDELLKWGVIPILNENDVIANEEIKFGDNDSLSAKVACVLKAERLIILTDVNGLYQTDPRVDKKAILIERVKKVDSKILELAGKKSSSVSGTGGMFSKIKAAQLASRHHIETVLVRGDIPVVLIKVASGTFTGTVIEGSQ